MGLANSSKSIVLWLLRGYKGFVSPSLSPACRFFPTCSEYSIEVVERFGIGSGIWIAIRRVLRCHPFGGSGYDPVMKHARARNDAHNPLMNKMNSPNIEPAVTES
ncbi:MAG: membrane protein insertion efficiency factor YidD [Acidobacteriota bacterium]|nr:membrane protein insertion efficiency factor YidD [Acidobacteriota bacterium]